MSSGFFDGCQKESDNLNMNDRHQTKPYPLRMSDDLREKLAEAAKSSGRSLNAEVVKRLEDSFAGVWPRMPDSEWMSSVLPADLFADISHSASKRGITLFAELLMRLKMFDEFMASDQAMDDLSVKLARAFARQLSVDDFTRLRNEVVHGVHATPTKEKKPRPLSAAPKPPRKLKID
jgi:hypothetical protein